MNQSISIRIPDEIRKNLMAIGKKEGKPLSDLVRESLQKYIAVYGSIQAVLSFLIEFCIIVDSLKLKRSVCRDREDDKILGLAVNAGADYIITGDKDLLVLKKFELITILTPREFWEIARNKRNSLK